MDYHHLNFRGTADLELALHGVATQLPPSIQLIVGIPRSGLLAASLLALELNLPFTDVRGLLEDRVLATGSRPARSASGSEGPAILILDDSVNSGKALAEVRGQLDGIDRPMIFGAAFVTTETTGVVDVYGEVVDQPRAFGWNVMHHPRLLASACLDIDGVLCRDPTDDENDDGDAYRAFLAEAQPLIVPATPVRYLVTSRLEKYRRETEQWLAGVGVEYERLVMLDMPNAEARRAARAHGSHKASFYRSSDSELFIESDFGQAQEIAELSGRQVFAVDRREMVYPSPISAALVAPRLLARAARREPPIQELERRAKAALARVRKRQVGSGP